MIFTVTLNPAVDKILFLDTFQRSRTTRLSHTLETLGGKGTHVFIDLKLLGVPCTALGIALGANGRKIIKMLEAYGDGVSFLYYDVPGMESRTNYEIVETSGPTCTMLTERGPILPRSMTDALLDQIRGLIKPGDMLVLSGDASNIEDTGIYCKLTQTANELGAKVILDASGPYLKEGLDSRPFLIKPNLEELSYLAGRELKTEADILAAMQELDACDIPMIAMTWSDQGAIVKHGADFYRVAPIQVEAVNEVGCGDAFLSGMIAGIEKKLGIIGNAQARRGRGSCGCRERDHGRVRPRPCRRAQATGRGPPDPMMTPSRKGDAALKELQYMETRCQMKKIAKAMWDRKLTNAAGGNFAVRVADNRILISPSMMSEDEMCDLELEEFLLVDYDGNVLEGTGKLSRETQMHILLLSRFKFIKSTIHAHPQFCMVFAAAGKPIKTVTEATMKRGEYFGVIEQAKAYSPQLAENVYKYFDERRELAEKIGIGCIMPQHGVVVSGDSLMSAFSCLERMETDAICNIFKNFI